jgi:hypothetical protein
MDFDVADFSEDDLFGCFLIVDPASGFHQVDHNLVGDANNGVFGDIAGFELAYGTVLQA